MRISLILASSLILLSSVAKASCNIYAEPGHLFLGDMILTGDNSYAGNPPGSDDGTPYSGLVKNGEVFLGERSPQKIATVKGKELFNLQGTKIATLQGQAIKDRSGKVVGTADGQYAADRLCNPDAALGGAAIYLGLN